MDADICYRCGSKDHWSRVFRAPQKVVAKYHSRRMTSGEVSCLVNSATTHTVLREHIYFTNFIPKNAPLTTFSGLPNLIEEYDKARIMSSNGTILTID
ncbi:hypothetical protein ACFXTN_031399 [Malus domestica]